MDFYQTTYLFPYDVNGTLERITKINGTVGHPKWRLPKMQSNSIEIYKGDNRMIRVYVKDENLDIIDLNGAEARLLIAEGTQSSSYLIRKTTENYEDGVIKTPELGEIIFFINTDDTKDLDPSQYYYQIIVVLKNGQRYTVCSDMFDLKTNLEYGQILPPPAHNTEIIDIPSGSSKISITLLPNAIIYPSLIAPNGGTENLWITNVVYTSSGADIYLNSEAQEDGWKISYFVVTV